jgi:PleD family two-component response regulator
MTDTSWALKRSASTTPVSLLNAEAVLSHDESIQDLMDDEGCNKVLKILIIEDSLSIIKIMKRLLENDGHYVESALNGKIGKRVQYTYECIYIYICMYMYICIFI